MADEELDSTRRHLTRPGNLNVNTHALQRPIQLNRTLRRRSRVAQSKDHLSICDVGVVFDTSDSVSWPARLPKYFKHLAGIRTRFLIVLRRGHDSRNGRYLPRVV